MTGPREIERYEAERYEKEPLLAILESYVLDVLGELSAEEVEEAACAVEELLGDGHDWRSAVRRRMCWSPLVNARIADAWCRNRAAAGDDPDAAAFARKFVDDARRAAVS
jgi:hypothetical protein